jgi:hypothetical protein
VSGRQGADVRAAEARCTEAPRAGGPTRGSRSQLAETVTIMIPLPYCLERVFDGGPPGADRGGHRRSGRSRERGRRIWRGDGRPDRPAGPHLGHAGRTGSRAGQAAPGLLHRQRVTGRTARPAWWALAPTTSTSSVALTSGCRRTVTWCDPTVLIGLRTSILRLSRSGPPAARTAAAMSAGPTEPNSLPLAPALVWSRTCSAASALAASLASSRPRMSRAARARLIRSICFSAPRVHRMASPRGTR